MKPINNHSFFRSLCGLSCISRLSVEEQCTRDYHRIWDDWAREGTTTENRIQAVRLLKICLDTREPVLNLSLLKLRSLPPLPLHIRELNISNNELISLPENSPLLTELHVNGNNLNILPTLPSQLIKLNISFNRNLSCLPSLPPYLQSLSARFNSLETLPELPSTLTILRIEGNRLTVLPELPHRLQELFVSGNRLQELPEFPQSLKYLKVGENQLRRLSRLPQELLALDVSNNLLTSLPENIITLPICTNVNISGNPLSTHVLQSLQRLTSSPDYHGPRIYFSMSDGQQNTLHRPLADAVTAWFPENKQSDVSQIWHAFEHEEHANTFSAFLDRLSDTVSARNTSGFREQVAAWLEKLSASAELRQQSFAVAADATESCEDRVALTWNNLRKTLLVHQASEGLFDNDTGALLSLGREMFRLEILEDIARDKVRTLHFVDEIEVYLAFQTMLAEKLQLSTAVKEMRFYGVSGVTANDLRTAEAMVRSREENEFTDWFSLWGPWHAVLKRTEADRWAQ
ncbi:T3SS effector E3 ubiquitin-protein ligase IpaH4.5, partial [Shigella flexneri]|nr:T3SS effector E3 ubiquitin-protein ligase IpaH4.5 [Shigella flexneri]